MPGARDEFAEGIEGTYEYEADTRAARGIQHSLVPPGNLKIRGAEWPTVFLRSPWSVGIFWIFSACPTAWWAYRSATSSAKAFASYVWRARDGRARHRQDGEDTATALALLNKRLLVRPLPGRYCATLYALFNPVTRKLTFSNAGFPYPVLVSEGKYSTLGAGGVPSRGVSGNDIRETFGPARARATRYCLPPTDLHKLRNERDEDFGWDQMEELWSACTGKSADESLD